MRIQASSFVMVLGPALKWVLVLVTVVGALHARAQSLAPMEPCCGPPPTVQTLSLPEGQQLRWAQVGPPNGIPIVHLGLIALTETARTYSVYAARLQQLGVRVLFLEDGHYFGGPQHVDPVTMDKLVDTYGSALEMLGFGPANPVSLVGASTNGSYVLALATKRPELISSIHLLAHRGHWRPDLCQPPLSCSPGETYFMQSLAAGPGSSDYENLQALYSSVFGHYKTVDTLDPVDASRSSRIPNFFEGYLNQTIPGVADMAYWMKTFYGVTQPWISSSGPYDVDTLSIPVYLYDAVHDQHLFPYPNPYSEDLSARLSAMGTTPPTGVPYPYRHVTAATVAFDQVMLNMLPSTHALHGKVILCREGHQNTEIVPRNQVTNLAPGSVSYQGATGVPGDCFWTRPASLNTARLWIGLANSDAVGLRVDLRVEWLVNDVATATATLPNTNTGSSGFNNALLKLVQVPGHALPLTNNAAMKVRVSARRTCSGGGHQSGTVRLWFNGAKMDIGPSRDAGSRLDATFLNATAPTQLFLRHEPPTTPQGSAAKALYAGAGSARTYTDLSLNSTQACPQRPFSEFGTWPLIE